MSSDAFNEDDVADYMEKMNDLLAKIEENVNDYGTCYLVVDPERYGTYYEGSWEEVGHFSFAAYRADVAELVQEFREFDSASLDIFGSIFAKLTEALDHIEKALAYEGLEGVRDALDGWHGRAAINFRQQVLDVLKIRLSQQAYLVEELGRAAHCYRELIQRARGDALGLAESLKNKVKVDGGGLSWGTILWVIGSIASAVTTFGASGATTALMWAGRTAYLAGVAEKFVGIESSTIPRDGVDREVHGYWADEFIPSCWERIGDLKSRGLAEAEALLEGLRQDLGNGEAMDRLVLDKPEVIGATSSEELADEADGEFAVADIAELKYAGAMQLPVMAQFLDDALGQVSDLSVQVDSAVGDSVVTLPSRHLLTEAVAVLADALTTTRDYLYESGQALVAVADNYCAMDAENQRKMDELYNTMIDEAPQEEFPPYSPDQG